MKLTGLYGENVRKRDHRWVAVWKLDTGGIIHADLPLSQEGSTKAEAREYALAHPPIWQKEAP